MKRRLVSIFTRFTSLQTFRRLIMIRLAVSVLSWILITTVSFAQPDVASSETTTLQNAPAAASSLAVTQESVATPAAAVTAAPAAAAAESTPAAETASTSTASATPSTPAAKPAKKPKVTQAAAPTGGKPKRLQLDHLYVVEGCEACKGLQDYLRRVGVKLSVSRVNNSPYSTFPTVVYSDGTTDNGERIYSKTCQFPKSVAVDECRSGG